MPLKWLCRYSVGYEEERPVATLIDGFEDLSVKNHAPESTFILEVPSNTGTTLAAVKDPLTEINKGIWVK